LALPFDQTTRALAQQTAGNAMVIWLVAGLGLLAWTGWFVGSRVTVFETSLKARLEVDIAAHPVNTQVEGRLLKALPALGTTVKQGEVLAELDSQDAQLRLQEAGSHHAALSTQAGSLMQEIAAQQRMAQQEGQALLAAQQAAQFRAQEASTAASHAADNERRQRQAADGGGAAEVDALSARAEAQRLLAARHALMADAQRIAADAHARSAGQQAQILALQRQLATLQGERDSTRHTLARLNLETESRRVRAPVTGTVAEVQDLRPGSHLMAGQKLVTLVPQGDLVLVAEFEPSAVLGRLRPGQLARMRLDGFPWMQWGVLNAKVTEVGSELRENRVQVRLKPEGPLPSGVGLQHGLPGAVEVALEQVSPLTLLLRSAGLSALLGGRS
jgi:membrane fusion protein (multidrug efflux system)